MKVSHLVAYRTHGTVAYLPCPSMEECSKVSPIGIRAAALRQRYPTLIRWMINYGYDIKEDFWCLL